MGANSVDVDIILAEIERRIEKYTHKANHNLRVCLENPDIPNVEKERQYHYFCHKIQALQSFGLWINQLSLTKEEKTP